MRKLLRLAIVLLSITGILVFPRSPVEAQCSWSDTFSDDSGIQSSDKVIQVSEMTEFGKNFTLYPGNPLLSLETSDPWDANGDVTKQIPGAVHADVLYFPDGIYGYKFWMVFTPAPETGSVPPGGSGSPDYWWERVTLVRSNDGIHWEKTSNYTNPVASPGPAGAWDSGWLADPDFVYAPGKGPNGESWFLYYTGCGGSGCAIDLSLSFDGLNWTKYSTSSPIAPAYRCPAVIYDEDTGIFHMWYNWGSFEIGYATSTDGINWTPYNPTNPGQWGYIVLRGTPGTFDQGGVTHMDVIHHDGKYWMYYLALPTSPYAGLVVGLATSPDGKIWTKHPQPVITPGGQTWNFTGVVGTRTVQSLYRPSAVVVGDTMYLYYGGTDDYVAYPAHNYEIGVAFSTQTPPDGYVEIDRYLSSSEYDPRPDETMAWYHMNEGSYTPIYPGEYPSQSDDTLAWYHFNEGSGPTAFDSGGSNANDGALNGPTWTTGLYGAGLSFDGNDRITVPNSLELNPTEAVTIEAWVKPAVNKQNNYVVIKMTPGTSDYAYGLKLENLETGGGYSELWGWVANSAGTLFWSKSQTAIPLNTWTHVAMTYEKNPSATTQVKLYMNGIEVPYRQKDSVPVNTSIRTNTGPLHIGVIPVLSPLYYQGVMDEVRILGRALTAAEIAADGAVSTSLVLDSSGNSNHGTPSSGVVSTAGMFSSGISFNGTNGYFSAQHHESLDTEEEVSIEAWVNPSIDKSNNYVAIKMVPASRYTYSYGLKLESQYAGYSEIGGVIQGSSGQQYFAYGGHVPTGEWTHIAMTYKMDPTNNTHIRLFQNGVEVAYRYGALNAATDTIPSNTLIRTHTGPLFFGVIPVNSPPSGPFFFNGVMDEVRILRRALTPDEILLDYGEGYEPSGNLTSELITPSSRKGWDRFYASDQRPEGTSIEYSILNGDGGVLLESVNSGDDISSLGNTPIRLYAQLITEDPASTPILNEWCVSEKDLNRAPVANDQSVTTSEDASKAITLIASDADDDPLSYSVLSGPSNGTLSGTEPNLTYTPDPNFYGTDSFTFRANDGTVDSNVATVTITVGAINDSPILGIIGNQTVNEMIELSFTATASDPDVPANTLSFSLVGAPAGAGIDSASGAFSWTPTEAQGGSYPFTVKVCDNGTPVLCDEETITVTVNEVNRAPVLGAIGDQPVDEMVELTFTATATDPDLPANTLAFSLVGAPAGAAIGPSSGVFTWTPSEAEGPGSYAFDVCVSDGALNDCETITVAVSEVDLAPVLTAIGGHTVDEMVAFTFTATATDADVPANTLTFSLTGAVPAGASINGSTGVFTWTPTEAQGPGNYTFDVCVSDGVLSDCETITVTANEVNLPPVADDKSVTTDEDTASTLTLSGSDPDGNAISYAVISEPAHGQLSGTPPDLTYTPNLDYYGGDSFTYEACDTGTLCDTATVNITISPVNDPPVATNDLYVTLKNQPLTIGAPGVLCNDNDVEGDLLTTVFGGGPSHGSLALQPDGSFVYTPDTDFVGTDSFTYVADDSAADSDVVNVTITVASIGDGPIAQNDHYSTTKGTPLAVVVAAGVIENDYDLYGHTLTATLVDGPYHGSITLNTDSSFSYTPEANFIGNDTFTYVAANDTGLNSNTAMVTIAVTAMGEVLVANNDSAATLEDNPITISVLDNDGREEGVSLTAWLVNPPLFGTVILNTDGSFTYTPGANFNGTDSFTYKANDGTVDSNVAMVVIGITAVNDAPVLGAIGNWTVNEMEELTFTATATDLDIPANTLTFNLTGAPTGAAIDPGSGVFAWTPGEAQGPGSYTFNVRVSDGALSDSETITVTVNEVNLPPVLDAIGGTTVDEEAPLTFTASATDADLPANTLTFSLAGAPEGAGIDPTLGAFTWTPTEAQGPGNYIFDVCVSDGPAIDCETITVAVNEVNIAPVLGAIAAQTVDEETPLTFTATATDPDLPTNTLSFSLVGAPAGAGIDPTSGAFTWTPTEAQGPGSYTFNVRVSDGALSDSETITVTVNEVNLPPVLGAIGNQTLDEMVEFTFTATATDPDIPTNTLTFSLVDAPGGASIHPTTRVFSWTPTEAQGPGSYTFDVCVSDGPLNDCETITVTVNEVNRAPELATIGNQEVQWSDELTFTATATDTDFPTNTLTFSLLNAPIGASFDESSHVFTWIPTEGQPSGTYSVTVEVCDNGSPSLCDQETITVTVHPEDALAWFDPDNPVAVQVAAPGGNSGSFSLIVYVAEDEDSLPDDLLEPGDISLAEVSMILQPVVPGSSQVSGICTKSEVLETEGNAVLPVTCTFNGVPVNTYTVQVTVDGGYYECPAEYVLEDVLVVYDPSLGFATGGGWFYWPETEIGEPGDLNYYPGDRTNFGFTMKYNKKGQNVQGSLLLIRHLEDGTIYRIKSNALYGLALGQDTTVPLGWASFSGKATYLEPGWTDPIGNHQFIVYVEDRNEPGQGEDKFWVEVKDQATEVIDEMSLGRDGDEYALPIAIQGGNIVVPHRQR